MVDRVRRLLSAILAARGCSSAIRSQRECDADTASERESDADAASNRHHELGFTTTTGPVASGLWDCRRQAVRHTRRAG